MPQRLKPYDRRVPSRFEMAFSFAVVCIVVVLGVLILAGAFSIDPPYKVTLALVLIGYGVVRLWMLKSRYDRLKRKEDGWQKLPKEDEENLRKV